MQEFLKNNFEVAKSSIETTISELIDIRDALDNAGHRDKKYDALQATIDSYEKLRKNFLDGKAPTGFEQSQWEAIFDHRLKVLNNKKQSLEKTIDDYSVLVNELKTKVK